MPGQRELVLAHQQQVEQVRASVDRVAVAAWASLGAYRGPNIDQLVRLIVPRIQVAQVRVASITDAFLAALAGERPAGVDPELVSGSAPRRGTDPEDVYRRPGGSVYKALAEGKPLPDAAKAGEARLVSLARTDLQLGMRQQEQRSLERYGFTYYTRVLTGNENCALCVVTSTRRYLTGDLKPIHPGCDCTVASTTAKADPGEVVNRERLENLYDVVEAELQVRDPSARSLGRGKTDANGAPLSDFTDLMVVRDHGEYGPTLAWRNDAFTGPGAIPGESRDRGRPEYPAERPISGFEAMSADQVRQQIEITEGLQDSDWRTTYLAKLRAQLATF